METKERIKKGLFYRRCIDAATNLWDRISFWTAASDVEFADGETAEEKIGAIKGIIEELNVDGWIEQEDGTYKYVLQDEKFKASDVITINLHEDNITEEIGKAYELITDVDVEDGQVTISAKSKPGVTFSVVFYGKVSVTTGGGSGGDTSEIEKKVEELSQEINEKADSVHNHDDRYYTESEVNNKLNEKINISNIVASTDITASGKLMDGKTVSNAIKELNNSLTNVNSCLTNENHESFNFGIKDGVRGYYTDPSRADDSFVPFKSSAENEIGIKLAANSQSSGTAYLSSIDINTTDCNKITFDKITKAADTNLSYLKFVSGSTVIKQYTSIVSIPQEVDVSAYDTVHIELRGTGGNSGTGVAVYNIRCQYRTAMYENKKLILQCIEPTWYSSESSMYAISSVFKVDTNYFNPPTEISSTTVQDRTFTTLKECDVYIKAYFPGRGSVKRNGLLTVKGESQTISTVGTEITMDKVHLDTNDTIVLRSLRAIYGSASLLEVSLC